MSWRKRLVEMGADVVDELADLAVKRATRPPTRKSAGQAYREVMATKPVEMGAFAVKKADPALQAAVRVGGKVYRGATHLDALDAIPDAALRRSAALDANNRGFVNERGRFMDRYKAADYARNFGLIAPDAPSWAHTAPEITSEYLAPRRKARGGLAVKPRKRRR